MVMSVALLTTARLPTLEATELTTKRSSTIRLTLLAGLGAALSACAQSGPDYTRLSFSGRDACYNEYRLIPELTTPCVQQQGVWHGPYYYGSNNVHYLGYSPVGEVLTAGIIYNLATRQRSSYQEPRAKTLVGSVVSRPFVRSGSGGFSSTTARPGAASARPGVDLRKPASSTASRGGFGSSSRSSGYGAGG